MQTKLKLGDIQNLMPCGVALILLPVANKPMYFNFPSLMERFYQSQSMGFISHLAFSMVVGFCKYVRFFLSISLLA